MPGQETSQKGLKGISKVALGTCFTATYRRPVVERNRTYPREAVSRKDRINLFKSNSGQGGVNSMYTHDEIYSTSHFNDVNNRGVRESRTTHAVPASS